MSKNNLTDLLKQQPTQEKSASPACHARKETPLPARAIHKPGEVNISAYFPAEVKAALRHVQAKTGKNIKDCLAEALQLLFRKHNVPLRFPTARSSMAQQFSHSLGFLISKDFVNLIMSAG